MGGHRPSPPLGATCLAVSVNTIIAIKSTLGVWVRQTKIYGDIIWVSSLAWVDMAAGARVGLSVATPSPTTPKEAGSAKWLGSHPPAHFEVQY